MSSSTISDREHLLLDIRKAYRLLFQYQEQIKYLVRFISDRYRIPFAGGHPKFSGHCPRGGSVRLDNWAWDWLNMYFYEFNFQDVYLNDQKLLFSAVLVNDTGYFDVESAAKIKLETFEDVNRSQSRLILVFGVNAWNMDIVLADERMSVKADEKQIIPIDEGMVYAHSFPLALFFTEEDAVNQLSKFEKWIKEMTGFDMLNLKTQSLEA